MLVHTGADRPHHALLAELEQRGEGALERGLLVIVRVVDEHDIEAVESEASEAVVDRTQHAVARVVEPRRKATRHPEDAGVEVRIGNESPSDLRREHEFVTRVAAQDAAEPSLREPVAVERRGVEAPDACVPCRRHRRVGDVLVERGEHVAERGATQPEARHRDAAPTERRRRQRHRHSEPPGYVSASSDAGCRSTEYPGASGTR